MHRRPPRVNLTNTLLPHTSLSRACLNLWLRAIRRGPFAGIRVPCRRSLASAASERESWPHSSAVSIPAAAALLAASSLVAMPPVPSAPARSEEHTSELQSLMRISYAVFCLKKKKNKKTIRKHNTHSEIVNTHKHTA